METESLKRPPAKVPVWRPLVAIAFLLILFVASRPVRSPATPFAALACVGFAVTEGLRGRRDRAAAVLEGVSALVALGAIGYVFAHLPS